MGLSDSNKKEIMSSGEEIEQSVKAFNELWEMDISDIWRISDANQFMSAMNGHVCRKSDYGSDMGALSHQERVIYHTLQLESEVYNGGFCQYFYNAYGDISHDLVSSFHAIGAEKTENICKKALSVFTQNIPLDREQRDKFLDEFLTDEIDDIFSECDDEFYEENDNLEELNYQFIMKNKTAFT